MPTIKRQGVRELITESVPRTDLLYQWRAHAAWWQRHAAAILQMQCNLCKCAFAMMSQGDEGDPGCR